MPDFPPIRGLPVEADTVYKFMAGRLDPAAVVVETIGTGTKTFTEDVVLLGGFFLAFPPATHNYFYGLLPDMGLRLASGNQITGKYAGSGVIYNRLSLMNYTDPVQKYFSRMKALLDLAYDDFTKISHYHTSVPSTVDTAFTTGANGSIAWLSFQTGIGFITLDDQAHTVAYFGAYQPEFLESSQAPAQQYYSTRLGPAYLLPFALPASSGFGFRSYANAGLPKPPAEGWAGLIYYDVPAGW